MKIAIRQAKLGLGLTSPNPSVGAVIVSANDKVLAKGYHHFAGGPHAEIDAIGKCLKKHPASVLKNSSIYVTLEPCSTSGKTGACTDSILQYQFSRVVYGCADPNPEHQGIAKQQLSHSGIEVITPVLEAECQSLIRFFSKTVTLGLPWVIAKSAMTLDGRTTLPPGQGNWITGKESLDDVHLLRSQVDAILIGGATLRSDNPRLTVRGKHKQKKGQQPWRIITSKKGDFPPKSRVFTDSNSGRTQTFTNQSLRQILKNLAKQGIQSVLLESGGKLLANALKNQLIDEVYFYYAPIIGGGNTHAVELNNISKQLSDLQYKKFGADFRIRALIKA